MTILSALKECSCWESCVNLQYLTVCVYIVITSSPSKIRQRNIVCTFISLLLTYLTKMEEEEEEDFNNKTWKVEF